MCVYIYIYVHLYAHVHVHVYVYVCVYVHACIYIYVILPPFGMLFLTNSIYYLWSGLKPPTGFIIMNDSQEPMSQRLFAFYIVFDTQMMLGSWGGHKVEFSIDDYAFAALNLYLDIINFFLYILEIVGTREWENMRKLAETPTRHHRHIAFQTAPRRRRPYHGGCTCFRTHLRASEPYHKGTAYYCIYLCMWEIVRVCNQMYVCLSIYINIYICLQMCVYIYMIYI